MASKNPDIVAVEACGISVEVDSAALRDVRFATAMGAVSDESLPDGKKMVWFVRAIEVLFGGNAYAVQTQLAEANGGHADSELFNEFLTKVLEAVGSKN